MSLLKNQNLQERTDQGALDEPLWTTKQTAEFLGQSESTLEQDRYKGRGVPYVKLGKTVRYRPTDVRKYIEQHTIGSVTT